MKKMSKSAGKDRPTDPMASASSTAQHDKMDPERKTRLVQRTQQSDSEQAGGEGNPGTKKSHRGAMSMVTSVMSRSRAGK